MAARAFLDHVNSTPLRNFATILNEMKQGLPQTSLRIAAIRNSFGDAAAATAATREAQPVVTPKAETKHVPAPKAVQAPEPAPTAKIVNPLAVPKPIEVKKAVFTAAPAKSPNLSNQGITGIDFLELPPATRSKALDMQRRQQAAVSKANQGLPAGCHAMAWNILPMELFQGELGRFLMIACDFHAFGPANTMILPTMPAGAQFMKLPRHPLVVSPQHVELAKKHITTLRDRVASEHRRANIALQNGDLSQIYNRTNCKSRYCRELSDIVHYIATAQFGNQAIHAHTQLFGQLLDTMKD